MPPAPDADVELARDAARQGIVLLLNGLGHSGGVNSTVPVTGGTLPLDLATLQRRQLEQHLDQPRQQQPLQIAVLGPNAEGSDAADAQLGGYGGGAAAPGATVTVADALRAEFGAQNVRVEQGAFWCNTSEARDAAAVASAVAAAQASSVAVLVLGDSGGKDQCTTCGEGKDR